jgi:phenylacetic acid degradation operon negative regulatory protein
MTDRLPIRTQIIIFTLFGDYILPLGESAWTTGLLKLLEVLGVSERGVRSTLSRMKKRGWMISTRVGRYSKYSLTERGLRIVREGEARIFEEPRSEWDGLWQMVVYSIPEQKRHIRSNLRQRLSWLGFGRLAPGTWIAPNQSKSEIGMLLEDVGAQKYAVHFGSMKLYDAAGEEIVDKCWDLVTLNKEYDKFLEKYENTLQQLREDIERGIDLNTEECFRVRFWMTLEYSQFPRRDPNLPLSLLKPGWRGRVAMEMFASSHQLLKVPSENFVSEVFGIHPMERHQLSS